MPARTASPKQIKGKNKSKKKDQLSEQIDPRQEEINQLIRERDEIRSKFNTVCSKLIENVIVEDYPKKTDEFNNQPCDLPLENLLNMIDDISYYRTALLEIYQENQDAQKISVDKKISQLARDQPDLFRKLLTMQQRLSFVIRERDLWKENAQNIQIMYATIGKSSRQIQAKKTASNYKELITSLFVFEVDQLEMGAFKKVNRTNDEILHAHRLKLEDVCRKFSSARLRSIRNNENLEELPSTITTKTNQTEQRPNSHVNKRRVSFSTKVDVYDPDVLLESNEEKSTVDSIDIQESSTSFSSPSSITYNNERPSACETPIEQMEPNLRMLIIKELSKDAHQERPPSRRSVLHNRSVPSYVIPPERSYRSLEWIELARLIGIRESEIEHWLSQSLQYPASRVISTWCNTTSPAPTVADLCRLLRSNELKRIDLLRSIENVYHLTI